MPRLVVGHAQLLGRYEELIPLFVTLYSVHPIAQMPTSFFQIRSPNSLSDSCFCWHHCSLSTSSTMCLHLYLNSELYTSFRNPYSLQCSRKRFSYCMIPSNAWLIICELLIFWHMGALNSSGKVMVSLSYKSLSSVRASCHPCLVVYRVSMPGNPFLSPSAYVIEE